MASSCWVLNMGSRVAVMKNHIKGFRLLVVACLAVCAIAGAGTAGAAGLPRTPVSPKEFIYPIINYLNRWNNVAQVKRLISGNSVNAAVSSQVIRALNEVRPVKQKTYNIVQPILTRVANDSTKDIWYLNDCITPELQAESLCVVLNSNWNMAPLVFSVRKTVAGYKISGIEIAEVPSGEITLNFLNELDKKIGENHFSNFQRAGIYYEQGRYEEALYQTIPLLAARPGHPRSYWLGMEILIAMEKYDYAAELMDLMHKNLDYQLSENFFARALGAKAENLLAAVEIKKLLQ